MQKFFQAACNFWNSGCCNCIRNIKDKPESTIECKKEETIMFKEEELNFPVETHTREREKSTKQKKSESPIKQKRVIKTWTEEEDNLLKTYYNKYGPNNWHEISKHISGRNPSQCSQRWRRKYKPEKVRKNWTLDEDNLLIILVSQYGQNWQLIANKMKNSKGSINRTGKQVRERYLNKLDPKITKDPFTEEEDAIILDQYQKIGKKWSEIAKILNGRPENSVKNRFYSHIKRKILKEEEEDESEKEGLAEKIATEENEENSEESSDHEDERNEYYIGVNEPLPGNRNQNMEPEYENNMNNMMEVENEPKEQKQQETYMLKLEDINQMQSTMFTSNYDNVSQNIIEPQVKPIFDPYASTKIGIEPYIKHIEYKVSLDIGNYEHQKDLDMLHHPSSQNPENQNVFSKSTETEKLLKSRNTFEKMESLNSNNDEDNNLQVKLKIEETQRIEEEMPNLIPVENYINNK